MTSLNFNVCLTQYNKLFIYFEQFTAYKVSVRLNLTKVIFASKHQHDYSTLQPVSLKYLKNNLPSSNATKNFVFLEESDNDSVGNLSKKVNLLHALYLVAIYLEN